jgi:hypothetical protein
VSDNQQVTAWMITEWVGTGCLCSSLRVNIGTLPDNVLLEIFDFYLVRPDSKPKCEDAWHTLVHVCKRWRSTVFASPHRLRLQLLCTNKRRMRNRLDLWPALPIVIKGHYGTSRPQVADSIITALRQHDRVCDIDIIDVTHTLLKKIRAMKMGDPFPVLASLRLYNGLHDINASPLPDSFLGGSGESREGMSSARGNGTHNVGIVSALEDPHLALHALLIPLSFLLRNGLQRDFARKIHSWRCRRCLGERGKVEESEVAEEDLGKGGVET